MSCVLRNQRGMTVLEVTLTLAIVTVIIGALTPTISAVATQARTARAAADIQKIVTAMQAFRVATPPGTTPFTRDGSTTLANAVSLLVSDGDMPRTCNAASGCDGGTTSWNRLVDNSAVDFLERHLVTNNPGNSFANDYPVAGGATDWKGAYINAPIDSDPWGNRYMTNTHWFNNATNAVIVLSAGPDESIDCLFTNTAANYAAACNDDIKQIEQN